MQWSASTSIDVPARVGRTQRLRHPQASPASALADAGASACSVAMTVADYLKVWLTRQRLRLQPRTWDDYRQALRRYVEPALGARSLASLTPMEIEQLYADLLDHGGRGGRPLALRTIRYVHAVLHKALADAVRTGMLDQNVSDRAAVPRVDPRRHDPDASGFAVWTASQARRFLDLIATDQHRDLWTAALGTGMRRGELLGVRWSDIGDDGQQVRVRSSLGSIGGRPQLKATKTLRVRRIHLDGRTAAAIQHQRAMQDAARRCPSTHWHNELDLVFTDRLGAPLVPQRMTHRFRRLVRRLDVPTIRLHDLRHTHATLLLQAGVPVKVVSERLGHASITITMDVYAHVLPAMDRDAADRYGALLE